MNLDKIDIGSKKILEIFSRKLDDKQKFYHVLEQIGKHIIKLTKLKENEDRPGHFEEEVADMYILAAVLMKLEEVDEEVLNNALEHFITKVDQIY